MNQFYSTSLVTALILCQAAYGQPELAARVRAHTEFLSSDELEGRGMGSSGSQAAATYIAAQFQKIGLEALGNESYLQRFSIPGSQLEDANVVGIVRAAETTDRSIVVTAHYDGYGVGKPDASGDVIYNGAVDNAVGVGALIELANLFARGPAPLQNLVFAATAAEENGTHGSRFYAENPPFPLAAITMVLNIDGFNVSGLREDYYVLPRQGVDFLDEIQAVARELGWVYRPPEWVDSMNTNFDTATFLSRGVPSFTLWIGTHLKGGEPAPKIQLGHIHTPADEVNERWDWSGVEEHLGLYRALVDELLQREGREGIGVRDPNLFSVD